MAVTGDMEAGVGSGTLAKSGKSIQLSMKLYMFAQANVPESSLTGGEGAFWRIAKILFTYSAMSA